MWHEPRWSSNGNDTRSQALWQALYDYGADLVLVGHHHIYERFAPQNANSAGQLDTTYGIRQITVGTGGASHHTLGGTVAPNSEMRNDNTYGVLKLTLHPNSYDWQFVPVAGGTFTDSGTALTHGAPLVVNTPTITPTATRTRTPTVTSTRTNTPTATATTTWTFTATP